jgi:DNA-binding response OmpR family regulator
MATNHVLIVEDDPTASAVMADVLQSAGYEVTETASGFGVNALVRRLSPAAVLLDLGLPYRPGTAVLADLKTDPHTAQVPVVVLSGLTEALTDERRAMAAAVLPKPIDLHVLLETVETALDA